MLETRLPVFASPTTLADLPALMAIETEAYALPWSESVYRRELTGNAHSHYLTIRPIDQAEGAVLAYGGLWLLGNEAHIATLATHPRLRGLGLGEFLLIALLELAGQLGATVATLEVRPSNSAARALYAKYRFEQMGRRRRYYSDNSEDALILTTPPLASGDYRAHLAGLKKELFSRLARIHLDKFRLLN
ncbi:MAG: ribosomal protein S18-alanine N-acetyltransferase [Anaerolineae bacterium]